MELLNLATAHPLYTPIVEVVIILVVSLDYVPKVLRLTIPIIVVMFKGIGVLVVYFLAAGALSNGLKELHPELAPLALWKMGSNIFEILLAFGMIYRESGVLLDKKPTRSRIDCFYFSVVAWTTVGFGDIVPKNKVTRLLVAYEVMLGYFTLIFLSSFIIAYAGYIQRSFARYFGP